ncbi:MAG: hypothetical protein IPK53_08540 [bacterium]|nr:hypothetical protein [bacterium]
MACSAAGATVLAGGFDYLVLVVAGVLLAAPAAIAFLAVMNLLQNRRAGHLGDPQRGGPLHRRTGHPTAG